jgi:hypothetical protein
MANKPDTKMALVKARIRLEASARRMEKLNEDQGSMCSGKPSRVQPILRKDGPRFIK